jgi:hypothetical protein
MVWFRRSANTCRAVTHLRLREVLASAGEAMSHAEASCAVLSTQDIDRWHYTTAIAGGVVVAGAGTATTPLLG